MIQECGASSRNLEGQPTGVVLGVKFIKLCKLLGADLVYVKIGTLEPLREEILGDAIAPLLVGLLKCNLALSTEVLCQERVHSLSYIFNYNLAKS